MKTRVAFITAAFLFTCFLFVQSGRAQVTVAGAHASSNGTYATLYAAFTALNAQSQTGKTITVTITANVTEATNFPSLSSGAWTSLTISPSGARTISGSRTGALITLNGADYVTIDGLNTGGNSLTIENSNTGTSASAVILTNGAINNIITNSNIKGATTYSTSYFGVITFSTGTNTSNTISYCNVGPSGANKPWALITSTSSANANNTIDHCDLHDYYNAGGLNSSLMTALYLYYGNGWTIKNNSIYMSSSVSATNGTFDGISVIYSKGLLIKDNYFGGTSSGCSGTAMTFTGSLYELRFIGTSSNTATNDLVNHVVNNTISNISITSNNATAPSALWESRFMPFFIQSGYYSIRNNNIGSMNANDNIVIDFGNVSGQNSYSICMISSYTANGPRVAFNNNSVGGITSNTTNFYSSYFVKSEYNNTGNVLLVDSVCYNTFGSPLANSIKFTNDGTGILRGIFFQTTTNGTPTIINGNTIQNITKAGTGDIYGIHSMAIASFKSNIIKDFNSASTGVIRGIYYTWANNYSIENNFISNLKSSSTSAVISGIYVDNSGTTISNNIVELGVNDAINNIKYGIYAYYGAIVYFNTVYIGGIGSSGTSSSAAFFRYQNSGILNIRNNIFNNARSNAGGTGKHYAISLAGTGNLTINYNDYYVSGSGGILGYLSSDRTTLAAWKSATVQDVNSLNINPVFLNAGGSSASSYIPSVTMAAATSTGITTDYAGNARSLSTPEMGAYEYGASVIWSGNTSTNWSVGSNWSSGVVPTSVTNITIPNVTPANQPVVNQDPGTPAVCNNLTINSGAVLTIAAGKALTVNGTLANNGGNGGLVINSGGSLIESTPGIAGTFNSVIPASEWHLISSPVSDAVSGMFLGKYLQTHTESTNLYTDIADINVALTPAKGYALHGGSGFTASYAGTLNTGSQSYTTSNASSGWNLAGNPYPCSIDWSAASGWTKTNVNNAIYVHKDASSWATFINGTGTNNGTRYIAPGQGFFVEATAAGTLAMTNDVKVHNATAFFKNGETARGLLRLEVSGNGFRDEAVVRFLPEASAGFDGNYDAYKLYGSVPEAAQLYTMGGDELSINALPETGSVAAGVRAGTGGTYTLAATEINDMPNVTLEDTKTGIFTELAKKSYTFQLEAGETGERFILHFSALGTGENPGGPVSIYGFGSTLYVNLNAVSAEAVYVYNMAGQLVARQNKVTGLGRIALPAPGAYTVKVLTPGESTVKKVVIY